MEKSSSYIKFAEKEAQEEFLKIIRRLNNENEFRKLLSWIHWNWLNSCTPPTKNTVPEDLLKAIASDLRCKLPPQAILPSEIITPPVFGENADCDPEHTVHVDAFLYDDKHLDTMCEEGIFPRNYCLQCGSQNTKPMNFISHSLSRERLSYIFKNIIQPIDGKVLLDIGSRLGAVLYAAFLYTKAAKVIGIEINSGLCKLQQDMIKKYEFQERIEVVNDDVMNRADVVQKADVIVMNNVFEFFLDSTRQVEEWQFLRKTIKKGTVLVTIPPLELTLSTLETGIDLAEWVQELAPFGGDIPNKLDVPEIEDLKQYLIL